MKYLINKGYDSEKIVEAQEYDYRADNKLVTFWRTIPPHGTVAVFTIPVDSIAHIELVEE